MNEAPDLATLERLFEAVRLCRNNKRDGYDTIASSHWDDIVRIVNGEAGVKATVEKALAIRSPATTQGTHEGD